MRICNKTTWLLSSAMLGLIAATPAMAQEATVSAADDGASQGVEDIVVTAQRREQNLQVVPVSITALSSSTLEANRVRSVLDLGTLVPNLTVRASGGGNKAPQYSMRGVTGNGAAPGSDKGISLYVDGVYLQNVSGSLFDLADIERIEVLRGPQGTLFGRNATGGAISVTTRDPSGELAVRQELTYGNYDQFRSKTRIDTPTWNHLAASFTYAHFQRRGDIRNLGAGLQLDYGPVSGGRVGIRTSPKFLGNENVESFAAAIKLMDVDKFRAQYKYDYSENDFTAEGVGTLDNVFPAALGPASGLFTATLANQPNRSILTPLTSSRPKAVNNSYSTPTRLVNWGHNFTASYDINDQITLKNIFSYRKTTVSPTAQLDGFGGLINVIPALGPIGSPIVIVGVNSDVREKQWSDELQLTIENRWFTLTAGYIHFHDFLRQSSIGTAANVPTFSVSPLNANGVAVVRSAGSQPTVVTQNSDAWYIQPEIHLTSRLDLVVGARITKDRKTGFDRSGVGFATPANRPITIDYDNSAATYLAGLNYQVTDNVFTFVKYATGYISGGTSGARDYLPETSKSLEAGFKMDLFDRRFRTNLALFDVDYTNLQFTTTGSAVGQPQFGTLLLNVGDASAKGFEWENTIVPFNGLTLTANLGYLDFKFKTVSPFINRFGNFVATYRPKWTGNAAIQYQTPPVFGDSRMLFRTDVAYQSRSFFTNTNPTIAYRDEASVDNVWRANGRIALQDVQIGGARAEIALWGRNLFDTKKLAGGVALGFLTAAFYERARTYGIDLSIDF